MIVSASYRTDIPAFYPEWFLERLRAGYCTVVNPYGGRPGRVSLRPDDVDGYVFWTRNARPFEPALEAVRAQGVPFVVQYTLTGYPGTLERSVVGVEEGLRQIRWLAGTYGPRRVVWRYDPVLITALTGREWHLDTFAALARGVAGAVDEVVMSFASIYRKTRINLDRAAREGGFSWEDPAAGEKRALLRDLAGIAAAEGLRAALCSQPDLLAEGLEPARCIDAARLTDVAGRSLAAREKGNRPGCLCAESRDIGAYDSCPHGCVYCYAVRTRAAARRRLKAHDPKAETLFQPLPPPLPTPE